MCVTFYEPTTQGGATALKNCSIQIITADMPLLPINTKFGMGDIWLRCAVHEKVYVAMINFC